MTSDRNISRVTRDKTNYNELTSKAKRIIRNSIEFLGRVSQLSLVTLTLPSLTNKEVTKICKLASELIRQLNQALARELTKVGLPGEIVCVREFQQNGNPHS
jgi:hypothetical protein